MKEGKAAAVVRAAKKHKHWEVALTPSEFAKRQGFDTINEYLAENDEALHAAVTNNTPIPSVDPCGALVKPRELTEHGYPSVLVAAGVIDGDRGKLGMEQPVPAAEEDDVPDSLSTLMSGLAIEGEDLDEDEEPELEA